MLSRALAAAQTSPPHPYLLPRAADAEAKVKGGKKGKKIEAEEEMLTIDELEDQCFNITLMDSTPQKVRSEREKKNTNKGNNIEKEKTKTEET